MARAVRSAFKLHKVVWPPACPHTPETWSASAACHVAGLAQAVALGVQTRQPPLRVGQLAPMLKAGQVGMAIVIGGRDEADAGFGHADGLGMSFHHGQLAGSIGDEVVEGVQVPDAHQQVHGLAGIGAGLQHQARQQVEGYARPRLGRLVRKGHVQADEQAGVVHAVVAAGRH